VREALLLLLLLEVRDSWYHFATTYLFCWTIQLIERYVRDMWMIINRKKPGTYLVVCIFLLSTTSRTLAYSNNNASNASDATNIPLTFPRSRSMVAIVYKRLPPRLQPFFFINFSNFSNFSTTSATILSKALSKVLSKVLSTVLSLYLCTHLTASLSLHALRESCLPFTQDAYSEYLILERRFRC
jgi:hypothetical protein